MPDPTPRPKHTPTHGVHVIPGQVPDGVVPPSTSMATPADLRPDQIRDLIEASSLGTPTAKALRARTTEEQARAVRERIRQRDEPDIPEIERRVREQIAADLKRAAAGRRDYASRAPDRMAAELETEARVFDTAARVATKPRDVMWGLLPTAMQTDADRPANRGEVQ